MKTVWHLLILSSVCIMLFGSELGQKGFWEWLEARRPEVSREMVVSGDWVTPRLNGVAFVTKPPLYYWTVAAMFEWTGRFDEFSARVPSMVSAIFCVLLTYVWGRTTFTPRAGFMAGMILATSFLFVVMARMAQIDMLLVMFTTAACCCFSLGYARKRTRFYLLAYAFAGFGMLTKNPLGLVIPLLGIAGFILISREFRLILDMKPWWGFAIFLLIVLPWYVVASQRVPGFWHVVWEETLGRYADPEYSSRLEQPLYYYLPMLATFGFWAFFLPGAIIASSRRGLSRPHLFVSVTALTTLLLFSSVGSKKAYYILPMFPPLAILLAKFGDDCLTRRPAMLRRWSCKSAEIPLLLCAAICGLLGVALPLGAWRYLPNELVENAGFGLFLIAAGIAIEFAWQRYAARSALTILTIAVIGVYLFGIHEILPHIDDYRAHKTFFQETARIVNDAPVVAYRYGEADAQFYLRRTFPNYETAEDLERLLAERTPTYVITFESYYHKLRQSHPQLIAQLPVVWEHIYNDPFRPGKHTHLMLLKTP